MQKEIEMVRNNIASKLRGLRAEKGISQKETAINTGLDIGTIIRYENGNTTQSLDKLIVLANYYKVNLLYFFSLSYENMYSNNQKEDNSIEET